MAISKVRGNFGPAERSLVESTVDFVFTSRSAHILCAWGAIPKLANAIALHNRPIENKSPAVFEVPDKIHRGIGREPHLALLLSSILPYQGLRR